MMLLIVITPKYSHKDTCVQYQHYAMISKGLAMFYQTVQELQQFPDDFLPQLLGSSKILDVWPLCSQSSAVLLVHLASAAQYMVY